MPARILKSSTAAFRGNLIVYNPAGFFGSLGSVLEHSHQSRTHPGELLSFDWVERITVVSANYSQSAWNLYQALDLGRGPASRLQEMIQKLKGLSHNKTGTGIHSMIFKNLKSVAYVPALHVHTSSSERAVLDREYEKYIHSLNSVHDEHYSRRSIEEPKIIERLQDLSSDNRASYCLRRDDRLDTIVCRSQQGTRLTYHMDRWILADLDFSDAQGPLTWYIERTQGYWSYQEDDKSRQEFLDKVARNFPAGTGGPESLSIYLPHSRPFRTHADQRNLLETSHKSMIDIMQKKGAATTTADGTSRIKLECIHNAPECPDCLGGNEESVQADPLVPAGTD